MNGSSPISLDLTTQDLMIPMNQRGGVINVSPAQSSTKPAGNDLVDVQSVIAPAVPQEKISAAVFTGIPAPASTIPPAQIKQDGEIPECEGWSENFKRRQWDENSLLSLVQDRGKYVIIGRGLGMENIKKTWFMIVKLKGLDTDEKGPWWTEEWSLEKGCTIKVKCSNGHIGLLTKHRISRSGIVDPQVKCCGPGGELKKWVFLDDYGPLNND